MSSNQTVSVNKSFLRRNLFLLILIFIILIGGGSYLYQNNIITFHAQKNVNDNLFDSLEPVEVQPPIDINNLELQKKVERLENLILELAENVQNIPHSTFIQPAEPPQKIILSNDEAYELILSINQIIINIDHQQIRNKHVQKLQNQYSFFQEQKFEELLILPDYTYLLQLINKSEKHFIEKEFMKNNNFSWLKKIIENIFEIKIAKNTSTPLAAYINALMNRHYDLALIEYEKLGSNQKIFFKTSHKLAQAYNNQQIFLENMI